MYIVQKSLGMVSACQWRDFTNATTAVDVYPLALFVTETGIVLTIVMKEANVVSMLLIYC